MEAKLSAMVLRLVDRHARAGSHVVPGHDEAVRAPRIGDLERVAIHPSRFHSIDGTSTSRATEILVLRSRLSQERISQCVRFPVEELFDCFAEHLIRRRSPHEQRH